MNRPLRPYRPRRGIDSQYPVYHPVKGKFSQYSRAARRSQLLPEGAIGRQLPNRAGKGLGIMWSNHPPRAAILIDPSYTRSHIG